MFKVSEVCLLHSWGLSPPFKLSKLCLHMFEVSEVHLHHSNCLIFVSTCLKCLRSVSTIQTNFCLPMFEVSEVRLHHSNCQSFVSRHSKCLGSVSNIQSNCPNCLHKFKVSEVCLHHLLKLSKLSPNIQSVWGLSPPFSETVKALSPSFKVSKVYFHHLYRAPPVPSRAMDFYLS